MVGGGGEAKAGFRGGCGGGCDRGVDVRLMGGGVVDVCGGIAAVESFELAEESVVLAVLPAGLPFLGLLVVLVEIFEFLPAFLSAPLVPIFLAHHSVKQNRIRIQPEPRKEMERRK